MSELDDLLRLQSGVISRRQAHQLGLQPHDIERKLRRREWVRLFAGVFIDHTGEPSWHQRAWAGVLYYWPAALGHDSALHAYSGAAGRSGEPIELVVDRHRHVAPLPGYRVRRRARLTESVRWNLAPPRVGIEDAALDVAADATSDFAAIEVLAEVCRSRRTTPARLIDAARSRGRLRRRKWLLAVLDDLSSGACSVLERGYLSRVERAHGLPAPVRQREQQTSNGARYRDVDYPALGLVIELDGRLFHDSPAARNADLQRDLDSAATGALTVRLGWGQVFDHACETAARLGTILRGRGWTGAPTPCGPACRL